MENSDYRKINDRTKNSSKYHKKDCTNIRAKLKEASRREIADVLSAQEPALQVGDKVRLHSAGRDDSHGICTVTKTRNYKTKGQRVYLDSQWGYGFMMWLSNMNYTKIENNS